MIEVSGKITLDDGSTSEFTITAGGDVDGYQQWGADTRRLGLTVGLLTAMQEAVFDTYVPDDEEEPLDEERRGGLRIINEHGSGPTIVMPADDEESDDD